MNTGLLPINLLTVPTVSWTIGPMLGWGIGVPSHGLRLLTDDTRSLPARTFSEEDPDWDRVETQLQNLVAVSIMIVRIDPLEAIVTGEDLDSGCRGLHCPPPPRNPRPFNEQNS